MSFFPVILPSSSTYKTQTRSNVRLIALAIKWRRFDSSGEGMRLTYLSDLDLDGSMVLGGDESVSGRALSGDVEIHNGSFVVLHLYYF